MQSEKPQALSQAVISDLMKINAGLFLLTFLSMLIVLGLSIYASLLSCAVCNAMTGKSSRWEYLQGVFHES